MMYRCRRCDAHYDGFLPPFAMSCLPLILLLWGGGAGLLVPVIGAIIYPFPLAMLASFVLGLPLAFLVLGLAHAVEWLCVSLVPCSECRSHRYAVVKRDGFGL
jgi:hypothetical protein